MRGACSLQGYRALPTVEVGFWLDKPVKLRGRYGRDTTRTRGMSTYMTTSGHTGHHRRIPVRSASPEHMRVFLPGRIRGCNVHAKTPDRSGPHMVPSGHPSVPRPFARPSIEASFSKVITVA